MTIRPATPADVPAVLPMVQKLAQLHEQWDPVRYDYKPGASEMYRSWLRQRAGDPQSVFLVAEHERLMADLPFLVGFVVGTVESSIPIYRTPRFGFIHDLFIDEDYRHEGTGRQLAMRALEQFRQIGIDQVRLETATANEAARNLFTSVGFRSSSIEMLATSR